MPKLNVHQIRAAALKLVRGAPGGLRYADLVRRVADITPETPVNAIRGALHQLEVRYGDQLEKPSRGLYRWREDAGPKGKSAKGSAVAPSAIAASEAAYYEPFARWLVEDIEEATIARPLGGAALHGKWGTPDVVGIYKRQPSDLVSFPLEIVAAEIKVDARAPVVAFGQATAYRLFATRSYIVLPAITSPGDLDRIDALSMLFGIGLVLLDGPPEAATFITRVRAQRFAPDMFYVNEFARRLQHHDRQLFDELLA